MVEGSESEVERLGFVIKISSANAFEVVPKFLEACQLVAVQGLPPFEHQEDGRKLVISMVFPDETQELGREFIEQDTRRKLRDFQRYFPDPPLQSQRAPLPVFLLKEYQLEPPSGETETEYKPPESPTFEKVKAGHQGST